MERKTWYWITLLGFVISGLVIVVIGVYDMYAFEIQDSHETVKDALKDARAATREWWVTGLALMGVGYVLTYVPAISKIYKKAKK
jgi:hypothetical protein